MKLGRSAAALCQLAILFGTGDITLAQRVPEVRRAQPVDDPPPVRRAVPIEESAAPAPYSAEQTPEPARPETDIHSKTLRSGHPRISKIPGRLSGRFRSSERLFFARGVLSKSESRLERSRQFPKSAERLFGKRVCRTCRLCLGRDGFHRKRLRGLTPALSSFRREIEGVGGGAFCALFRSTLSRSARSEG